MEFLICQICGKQVKRLYGKHLNSHNITSFDYKNKFGVNDLTIKDDLKNTKRNSGKHMKTEKYKIMFSEKIKGEKNPNHKLKTTKEIRKSRSPFSKDFKNYKDDQDYFNFLNNIKRKYNTKLSYYIDKGYSKEHSMEMLSERQSTFSLETCIDKYGKEDGIVVFNKRQEKWINSVNKNGNLKGGYSKISQELFFEISKNINTDNIYFALKNKEYTIKDKNGKTYLY